MESLSYFFTFSTDLPPGLGVNNFSGIHLIFLSIIWLLIGVTVYLGKKSTAEGISKLIKGSITGLMFSEVARIVWAVSIGHFDIKCMLPLHLCGVMVIVVTAAVFTGKRLLKEFAFSTGLPGAFFALLTPDLGGYPLISFQYLQSNVSHALLVLIPLLWVSAEGYRPDARLLPKCFLMLLALTGLDALINSWLKSNYLFISYAPQDTPIELFDKWVGYPWYVGLLLISVVIVWLVMYLPFKLGPYVQGNQEKIGQYKA